MHHAVIGLVNVKPAALSMSPVTHGWPMPGFRVSNGPVMPRTMSTLMFRR
jgi:hypothetical protein